jgi:PPOX class probable F420-dependent enzyme
MPAEISRELDAFLREPRHGIAATTQRDGAPQLTPIWFDWDGSVVRFSVTAGSAKNRNLRRDQRVAICIDDSGPNRRYVTLYGQAELDDNPETITEHIRRIRQKYGHTDETTVEIVRREGRVLVSFRPERIVGSRSLRTDRRV